MKSIILAVLLGLSGMVHAAWNHEVTEDKMGRGSDEIATVLSSNSLSLSPPYDGKQNASFSLRWLRDNSNQFVVSIEKGQIICEHDGCPLLVKVDDKKAFRIIGSHPKDGSSDVIVGTLNTEELRKLKDAQKILIEITIYQNGEHILEFDAKDNPFIGRKVYLLPEVSKMINTGKPPKSTKYAEIPMDIPDFNICKKVVNEPAKDDELKIVEINKKDEITVASYFEDSVMKQTCKRNSKKSVISFLHYDRE